MPNKSLVSASSPKPTNSQLSSISVQYIGTTAAQTGRPKSFLSFKRITASENLLNEDSRQCFRLEGGRMAFRQWRGNAQLFWRTGIGQAQGNGTASSHFRNTVVGIQSLAMPARYENPGSFPLFYRLSCRADSFTVVTGLVLLAKSHEANEVTTMIIGYMEFGKLGIVGNRSQVVPLRYVGAVATIVAQFHAKKGVKLFWKMSQMDIESILSNLNSVLLGGINLCDQQVGRQVSATEHITILIPCYYMVLLIVMSIASHSKFPNFLNKHIRSVFQKLLEKRKLDSLKTLADIAFYTIHQGLGQIVLFLVQLVSKYMLLKQTTAKMSLTYVECLLYKAYRICISLNKFLHIGMGLYQFAIDNIMGGCTHLYAIDHRKLVQGYLNQCGLEFVVVIGTAVANRYGRGGSMAQADKVFEEMPENETWVFSALLSTFVVRRFSNGPLDMLGEIEMSGLTTNQVTTLGILSTCSQVVLVLKSLWSVDVIQDNHSSEPPIHHYACLVDIRGRVGLFQVMERVFGEILFRRGRFWAAACIRCQARYNITVGVFVWLSNFPLWQAKDCAMILPLGATTMRVQAYGPMSKGWPPPHVHLEDKVVFGGRGIDRIQHDVSRGMTSWLG